MLSSITLFVSLLSIFSPSLISTIPSNYYNLRLQYSLKPLFIHLCSPVFTSAGSLSTLSISSSILSRASTISLIIESASCDVLAFWKSLYRSLKSLLYSLTASYLSYAGESSISSISSSYLSSSRSLSLLIFFICAAVSSASFRSSRVRSVSRWEDTRFLIAFLAFAPCFSCVVSSSPFYLIENCELRI